MDREVIEHKLESLRRCLQRVAEKCPSDPDKLSRDPDLQDIVTLNLSRAVQLCVDPARIIHERFCCDRGRLIRARWAKPVRYEVRSSWFEVPKTSNFRPRTVVRLDRLACSFGLFGLFSLFGCLKLIR